MHVVIYIIYTIERNFAGDLMTAPPKRGRLLISKEKKKGATGT